MFIAIKINPDMSMITASGKTKEEVIKKIKNYDMDWYMMVKANNGPFFEGKTVEEAQKNAISLFNSKFGKYAHIELGEGYKL